jgi:hypothetical protein
MTLAIFQNDRVYEGTAYLLNAVYPRPSLSRVAVDPVTQKGAEIFAHVNPSSSPLFREDSFDPTTRIVNRLPRFDPLLSRTSQRVGAPIGVRTPR